MKSTRKAAAMITRPEFQSCIARLQFEAAIGADIVRMYRKSAIAAIRPAIAGEVIETWLAGERETINTANAGDHVVRGTHGEHYIITSETLAKRYGPPTTEADAEGFRQYPATGSCHAFEYEGQAFTFKAPWGERMIVNPGDYIATPAIGSSDIYRIERNAFLATYHEAWA
jgi:hypothetical protein